MSDRLWLLLDQGGHSGRAIVLDSAGELHAVSRQDVSTTRGTGRAEQDASALLASLRDSIDDVAQQLGDDVARIEAAALVTQRSSVVCWDRRTGEPLSPAISWQDRRAASLFEHFPLDAQRVRQITGMRRSPHYGASKLTWCRQNIPAVNDALRDGYLGWGPLAAFLLQGLLREKPYCVDATNAQRSLLWSLGTANWSPELADAFGIPVSSLPDCVGNVHSFGHVQVSSREIPLRICAGDQNVVPFAFDIDATTACINAGTGAFLLSQLAPPIVDEADNGLLTTLQWLSGGDLQLLEEGTVNGAGAALSWLAEEDDRDIPWQQFDDILFRTENSLLFLNGIGGLGAPWWWADFESRFVGGGAGFEQRLVAVVESIVFLLQANIERLMTRPRKLLVTGGLSRSSGFCQRIASLSGLPTERSPRTEASTYGVARKLVPAIPALTTERVNPLDAQAAMALRERYAAFTDAMNAALR